MFMPYRFDDGQPESRRPFHSRRRPARAGPDRRCRRARSSPRSRRGSSANTPRDNTDQSVRVAPLQEAMVANARPALLLLGGAVAFVLLVACANLANLLLAQGAVAPERAGGARRAGRRIASRLVRQLLTESMMLSVAGAAAGLALARARMRVAHAGSAPPACRGAADITLDGTRAVVHDRALTLVTGRRGRPAAGVQLSRGDVHAAVREGGRGQSAAALQRPVRELLIASQIALALVLLTGAGLMLRSLWQSAAGRHRLCRRSGA